MCMCKYPFNLNLQYKHLKQSFYIKTYMFCDIFYYFGKKVICYSFYHGVSRSRLCELQESLQ